MAQIFNKIVIWAAALFFAVCSACTFFALFLGPLGGNQALVFGVLILLSAALTFGLRALVLHVLAPFLGGFSRWVRLAWVLGCLLAGVYLFFAFDLHGEQMSFVYPRHTLQIIPSGETNPLSNGNSVAIHRFADGQAYEFSLAALQGGPDWQVRDGVLAWNGISPEALQWDGTLMNRAYLYLGSGPDAGIVRVVWDGQEERIDLYNSLVGEQLVKLPVNNRFTDFVRTFAVGAMALTFSIWLLLAVAGFTRLPVRRTEHAASRWGWLLYALPMMACWGLTLMVYFPGILSADSVTAWNEIAKHAYTDWAPAIHTLLEGLMLRLWNSPASMAILQILALSLTAAWGLGMLRNLGLPRWAAWLVAGLFAISPANATMSVTMWKDVLYGVGVFALSLLTLRIVTSRGAWLERPLHWVVLGLVGAVASLFRHNGVAVVAVVLVVLLGMYWKQKRGLLVAIVIAGALWVGVRGPLYTWVGVQKNSTNLSDTILLHHIGAHLKAGTPLTDDEKTYLNALRPLSQWAYNGCNVNSLFFVDDFNHRLFEANSAKTLRVTIDLALRDPKVEVDHFLTSSSMIWKVNHSCQIYYYSIYSNPDQSISWIDPNDQGVKEASLLPGLVRPLTDFLRFSVQPETAWWLWGPAIYLYLALFATLLLALRFRSWRYLLVGLPILVQSLVMVAITISTDFRYQYSAYLIGLFCIALLFLPQEKQP
jgi:hypothetical protein